MTFATAVISEFLKRAGKIITQTCAREFHKPVMSDISPLSIIIRSYKALACHHLPAAVGPNGFQE